MHDDCVILNVTHGGLPTRH